MFGISWSWQLTVLSQTVVFPEALVAGLLGRHVQLTSRVLVPKVCALCLRVVCEVLPQTFDGKWGVWGV